MIGYQASQLLKPEKRKLRQHLPLVRDRRRQHHIKRRQPIRRHNQQLVANLIYVAYFAAPAKLQSRKIRLRYYGCHLWGCQVMFLDAAPHILAQRQAMSTVKKSSRQLNLISCGSKKGVGLAAWPRPPPGTRAMNKRTFMKLLTAALA